MSNRKPRNLRKEIVRLSARALGNAILDRLLPRQCLTCGCGSGADNLCGPCAAELPRLGHACLQCALPLHHEADRICGRCLRRPPPWDDAAAALAYTFPVDHLVRRFKFSRSLSCGQVLAEELARAIRTRGRPLPDCIVPIPLHRWRHFSRAYNQADFIARRVGRILSLPVRGTIICRRRRTRAHSGLDAAARKKNIRGAFRCRIPPGRRDDYSRVALLDDVMTTGATLAECTRTLKKAGVRRVSVWVTARTLEPGQVSP
jgi:ComF family protein